VRITKASIYILRIGGRNPIVVKLDTDEGISGLGDAAIAYGIGATAAAGMIKDLAEGIVLGRDPFRIEAIWSEMYDHSFWAKGGGPIVYAGISAIEQALWDIKGKALGVPVYELIGGKMREDVRVYANGWHFRAGTPGEFARAAEATVADGYTALKMYPLATAMADEHGRIRHVSNREIDRDYEDLAVAKVREVRRAIGPKIDLMLDMSAELTTDAVIRLGQRVREYDIMFFEEPVEPTDAEALKKVSESWSCAPPTPCSRTSAIRAASWKPRRSRPWPKPTICVSSRISAPARSPPRRPCSSTPRSPICSSRSSIPIAFPSISRSSTMRRN
jgi:galactonate dehydratase